jgi:hypothetical protein
LIRRLISKLKKFGTYMDELWECMLILVSNEPYWKREELLAQLQTATIEEPKDSNITAVIVGFEIDSQEGQTVPCGTTS